MNAPRRTLVIADIAFEEVPDEVEEMRELVGEVNGRERELNLARTRRVGPRPAKRDRRPINTTRTNPRRTRSPTVAILAPMWNKME